MRALVLAIALALAAAAPAAASWSFPKTVSPPGVSAATPFVGFATDGSPLIGFACYGFFRGHCRAGSRAGFARAPFDAPLSAAVPHVAEAGAVDPRGGAWLMGAVDKHDDDRMEAMHIDAAGRVVERRYITPRGTSSRHPVLAVNARGDVLAAWEMTDRDGVATVEAAWRRHGRPWRLHPVAPHEPAERPAVALDDDGAGIVAFRRERYVRVADLGPRGWGRARAVGIAGGGLHVPVAAAMAPSGVAAVTWMQNGAAGESGPEKPAAILVARRAPHEAFSLRRTSLLDGHAMPRFYAPSVAVAGDGSTLAGWIAESGPAVAYAPPGGRFETPVQLSGDTAYRIAVALAGGRAYAAWTDGNATRATDGAPGAGFAAPQVVGGGTLLQLALAADDHGAVLGFMGGESNNPSVGVATDVNPAAR
jgi:hypothetical protein